MNGKAVFYSLLLSGLALCAALPAMAAVEPDYTHKKPYAVTPWYGKTGEAQRRADLGFIAGMRPHHAGALSMSEEYLGNPEASNARLKQLARGIIRNQAFEILMLDTTAKNIAASAQSGQSFGRIATKGLAQQQRFVRAPIPGPLDALSGNRAVSAADVEFAKAMIIHHQGALDMARAYLGDPAARNGYLRRMCLDILLDQSQEIAFMNRIVGQYPGDPDAIVPDPSMIHGMEGMHHAKTDDGAGEKKAGGEAGKPKASTGRTGGGHAGHGDHHAHH